MTALNTDATLFYSFYQRGREATYWRWTRFVRATLAQQRLDTSRMGLDREYTTVYEMQLDSGGQFLRGVLLQSSGVQRLDEAALLAFAQARSFPNPPAEMIDADGLIRWVWSFTVEANPLVAGP
jgi:TonB family protein